MTKEQLIKVYNILNDIYYDFDHAYYDYKKGSNIKIRKDGERRVDNALHLALYHIQSNEFILNLLIGTTGTAFEKAIVWDEFKLPQWFKVDMPRLLTKIKEEIDKIEK